jgi:hypothetical protein
MAESTLSITYAELKQDVAHYLGHGRVESAWSDPQVADITAAIRAGLRQFYFPPKIFENKMSHKWTFLTPVSTLDLIAPYSTGTVEIDNGFTTMTLTDGVWPDWTATNGSIVIDTTEYIIASRTNDTVIELATAWPEDTITAEEFVLKHDGNYDLPDDFASIVGKLVIETENYEPEITIVGEGVIRNSRQQNPQNSSGSATAPYYAAIRPKVQDTTIGQRFEIMFYPLPSTAITVSYAMRVLPEMLSVTSDPLVEYPYGGGSHSQTILASCLAAAEVQVKEGHGPLWDAYKEALSGSITSDNAMNSIQHFGYNGDNSDAIHRPLRGSRNDNRRWCNRGTVNYTPGS